MEERSYGETNDCKGCRYWSEMIAKSESGGPIQALCINSKSDQYNKYKAPWGKCSSWESGEFGAIDAPGCDGIYKEIYNESEVE